MVRVSSTSTRKVLEWQPTDSDSERERERDDDEREIESGGAKVTG